MHEQIILTELLDNEHFLQWVRMGDRNERRYWSNWVERQGCSKQLIDQAIALLDTLGEPQTEFSDEHVAQFVETALAKAKKQERRIPWLFQPAVTRAAAAALLLTILTWAGYQLKYRKEVEKGFHAVAAVSPSIELTEISNTEKALQYVQLPDGSSVVLQLGGNIRFSAHTFASGKREVFLSGEAFFEVTKDPEHPFLVHSNGLITRVHGTSFSVRSGTASDHVVVSVKTGTVSLFADQEKDTQPDSPSLILTPNQKAEFDPSRRTLTRITSGKSRPLIMPIEAQVFTYSSTPVSQVFEALESAYGIQIDFDREKMAACSITAILGDEPLENKLKWICTILEASYRMEQERIMILGKSCQ